MLFREIYLPRFVVDYCTTARSGVRLPGDRRGQYGSTMSRADILATGHTAGPARPYVRMRLYAIRSVCEKSFHVFRTHYSRPLDSRNNACGLSLLRSELFSLAGRKWRPPAARVTRAHRPNVTEYFRVCPNAYSPNESQLAALLHDAE